jgi:hypothetical protein
MLVGITGARIGQKPRPCPHPAYRQRHQTAGWVSWRSILVAVHRRAVLGDRVG